jgi:hypothetical protein
VTTTDRASARMSTRSYRRPRTGRRDAREQRPKEVLGGINREANGVCLLTKSAEPAPTGQAKRLAYRLASMGHAC